MTEALDLPAAAKAAYPWTGAWLDVDGGRLHYLDEGPRDAPVLLCVHGNPTWSFYWRRIVAQYSDRYRVVVPDHIGCGMSDKPQSWPYRLQGHVDNLEALVDHLGLTDITFIVHDWGGAIGMGVATRRPERVARLVITNTAAFRSERIPLSIATVKWPVYGPLAVRGFNGFARVALIRATAKGLSAEAKQGLLAPYGSWHDRIATLRFVQDIPMGPDHPSWAELSRIDAGLLALAGKPMLILWGDDDFCFDPTFRAEWERRFPAAEVHAWEDVGHYVMEDAPDRVVDRLDTFLAAHPLA
ncbi:MAG: alpha/beta fold hydrolase [Alphaproteobacteria bacterium]|nr:alpha/beta fold hydrolase [Alphaproteobacteria bacterium]